LVILEMESPKYICLGWPWTMILTILASHVVRITGMNHGCPVNMALLDISIYNAFFLSFHIFFILILEYLKFTFANWISHVFEPF
jgi:hypothetical protein